MNLKMLTGEITAAFANVPWLYDTPAQQLTPESTAAIVEDLFLMSDEDKRYELPRAMCVAVAEAKPPLRELLLRRLIEFLDVDFYDPERTNDLLKEARLRAFSSYSTAQSLAIWSWLSFVKVSFELTEAGEQLTSAMRYWGQRSQSQIGGKQ
jgi:hypothetical protein